MTDPHGAKASEPVTITVTEAPKEPALTLLSSATVVGEYTEESEAALNEDNKTFTVKMSGGMRFYKLRSTGEAKLKVTSIQLQGDNAVITYNPNGDVILTEHAVEAGNDGVVVTADGTKYVSSVRYGSVSRIRPGQDAEIIASGIPSAASMCYDSTQNQLVIPLNGNYALAFVPLN